MMKTGIFREDLFYRLNVIPIYLPSLIDRKDDLDSLVMMFLRKFNEAHNRRVTGITPDALAVLKKYDWPGNIRELENVIEHMFVMEVGNKLSISALPESILNATGTVLTELSPTIDSVETDDFEDLDLGGDDLDDDATDGTPEVSAQVENGGPLDFNAQKEAFEKEFIIKALKTFKGRINQTALHANIPKKTLLRKIEKYGINAKEYIN
jgi:DNA-binding NtrC family response regulator